MTYPCRKQTLQHLNSGLDNSKKGLRLVWRLWIIRGISDANVPSVALSEGVFSVAFVLLLDPPLSSSRALFKLGTGLLGLSIAIGWSASFPAETSPWTSRSVPSVLVGTKGWSSGGRSII